MRAPVGDVFLKQSPARPKVKYMSVLLLPTSQKRLDQLCRPGLFWWQSTGQAYVHIPASVIFLYINVHDPSSGVLHLTPNTMYTQTAHRCLTSVSLTFSHYLGMILNCGPNIYVNMTSSPGVTMLWLWASVCEVRFVLLLWRVPTSLIRLLSSYNLPGRR